MELKAQNQVSLLEPWYQFTLRINQDQVGRAINDIEKMGGKFKIGESDHDIVTITGQAPVAQMQDYANTLEDASDLKDIKNVKAVLKLLRMQITIQFLILTIHLILFFVLMAQVILLFGMKCQVMPNILT